MKPKLRPTLPNTDKADSTSSNLKLSQSSKKLRSILASEEDPEEGTYIRIFRNEEEINIKYFNFPIKLLSLFSFKEEFHKAKAFNCLSMYLKNQSFKNTVFTRKVQFVIRSKIKKHSLDLFLALIRKYKQKNHLKTSMKLFSTLTNALLKKNMRIFFKNVFVLNKAKSEQKVYSPNFMESLKRVANYDKKTFYETSTVELKSSLEAQLNRIKNPKSRLKGGNSSENEKLILLVLNNHIRALIDVNSEGEEIVRQLEQYHKEKKKSMGKLEKDSLILKHHEDIINEFEEQEGLLDKLIIIDNELASCDSLLGQYIGENENTSEKIIKSRIRTFTILRQLIRQVLQKSKPLLIANNSSIQELGASHVRAIIQELDQKVYELSTICEQIPQLQTFKRTLDLSMPEHNLNFTKIVDVIIELHHKVNKLLSRRPQNLLREVEEVEKECEFMQTKLFQFIDLIESDNYEELKPIIFSNRNIKSPEHFKKIQRLISSLSEHTLYGITLEEQNYDKIHRIKNLIQFFWNILSGMQEYENQWLIEREREKSEDEDQIIQMLESCLKIIIERKEEVTRIVEEYELKIKSYEEEVGQNNVYLEEEIVNVSNENKQLKEELLHADEQIEEWKIENRQLKQRIRENEIVIQQLKRTIEMNEKRERLLEARIEELEVQNEQKKLSIKNVTNELKRANQLSEKYEAKIYELSEEFQNEKENFQKQIIQLKRINSQQKTLSEQKMQKNDKNNETFLTQIHQLQTKVALLEQEKSESEESFTRKIRDLEQKSENEATFILSLTRQKQKYEKERKEEIQNKNENQDKFNQDLAEKDEQIFRLNEQINGMMRKHEEIEVQMRLKIEYEEQLRIRLSEMEKKVVESEKKISEQNKSEELEFSNKMVSQLEKAIKRKEKTIEELQNYQKELIQKLNESQKVNLDELEHKHNQKVKDLQAKIVIFFEQQTKMKTQCEQKNKEINNLKNKIAILSSDLNKVTQTLNTKEIQIFRYTKKIEEFEIHERQQKRGQVQELKKQSQKRNILEKQVEELRRQIEKNIKWEKQAEKLKKQNEKKMKLEIQLAELKKQKEKSMKLLIEIQQLKRQKEKRMKLQKQVQQLRKQSQKSMVMEKQIQKLNKQRQKTTRMEKQILQLKRQSEEKTKLERQIERLKRQIEKKVRQIQEKEKELKKGKQREVLKSAMVKQLEEKILLFKSNENQVQYLKEKIRSLEDLIDIFTQENTTLQSKLRQFRSHDFAKELHIKAQQTSFLQLQLQEKKNEISVLKAQIQENRRKNTSVQVSPFKEIERRNMNQTFHSTPANKLHEIQEEEKWIKKQNNYIEKIKSLEIEIQKLREGSEKYYLRIEGEKLEQILHKLQSGSLNMNLKIDEMLSESRKNSSNINSLTIEELVEQNRYLIEMIKKSLSEKEQISLILESYPNPNFLTEYVFKIITHFSELHPESETATAIWQQLQNIQKNNQGGQYFVTLEEFTKYILQQNTIQVYKKQLKAKAEELEALKIKLDQFLNEQIRSEQRLSQKTVLADSKIKMYRERYHSEHRSKVRVIK